MVTSVNPHKIQRLARNILVVGPAEQAAKCSRAIENAGFSIRICENLENAGRAVCTPLPLAIVVCLADCPNGTEPRDVRDLAAIYPDLPVFCVIAQGSPASELFVRGLIGRKLLHGAFIEPFEAHKLTTALQRLVEQMARPLAIPAETSRPDGPDWDLGILGESPAIQKVRHAIRKVALTDVPVLITGESGTGKELAALAIHQHSRRRAHPFVAINCAGMPEALVASELYGHERGAFTGAFATRIGRLEAAKQGTCFLDEIGDFPTDVQGHLLRFLQEKTIERVGSTTSRIVDARIIAATHTDLKKAVAEKRFRDDLFYRLNIFSIEIPPLRERSSDIEPLARHFIQRLGSELNSPVKGLRKDALTALQQYTWPGNVRELIAVLQRAIVMAEDAWISAAELRLPGSAPDSASALPTLAEARSKAEARTIRHALEAMGSNVQRAARALGVSRNTLYRLAERHAIPLRPPADIGPPQAGGHDST